MVWLFPSEVHSEYRKNAQRKKQHRQNKKRKMNPLNRWKDKRK